jgi:hypothetical protein
VPDTDAVRAHVLAEHRETVAAVLSAADEAAGALEEPAPRAAVVAALEDHLDDDLRASLVALLRGAVAAADRELLAEPVPASPYLVVTARGPLVRATLSDARLVVLVRAFERADDGDRRGYVRGGGDPEGAVAVRFRRSP